MKKFTSSMSLALALVAGSVAQAQTFEELKAAYARGDYKTAFAGYKSQAEKGNRYSQYNLIAPAL